MYKQSVYTTFADLKRKVNGKVDAVVDVVTKLYQEVLDRGLATAGSLAEEPA